MGRPQETQKRTVEKELMASGLRLWTDAASAAKHRIAWMERLCSPIPHIKTHRKDTTDIDDEFFNASPTDFSTYFTSHE